MWLRFRFDIRKSLHNWVLGDVGGRKRKKGRRENRGTGPNFLSADFSSEKEHHEASCSGTKDTHSSSEIIQKESFTDTAEKSKSDGSGWPVTRQHWVHDHEPADTYKLLRVSLRNLQKRSQGWFKMSLGKTAQTSGT